MPAYNKIFTNTPAALQFQPQALKDHGAFLEVEINIPTALATLLKLKNQSIPQGVKGVALIDTGATNTCVDSSILNSLGVSPVGVITSGTANGTVQQNLYPVNIKFPNENLDLDFTSCIGVNIQGQTALGLPVIALLGRDLLANFILIYNGPAGMYTITT